MTSRSDSISTFDNEQFEEEEPIIVKTSITKELYHGNKLKSRIELSGSREFPSKVRLDEQHSNYSTTKRRIQGDGIPNKSNLKEYNIDMQPKHQDGSASCCTISVFIILSLGILLALYLPSDVLQLKKIENDLHARVLNQDKPISVIVSTLREFNNNDVNKVKVLTGPTGVGKSHVINILKEHISSKHLNVFYSKDLNDLIEEKNVKHLCNRFYLDDYLIIVFDDLVPKDLDKLNTFLRLSKNVKSKILTFVVVNTQSKECLQKSSTSDYESLEDLSDYNTFNYLDETIVRKWLKKVIEKQNINDKYHDEIINNLLKGHDIECHGLKGLYSKLTLELPKYK